MKQILLYLFLLISTVVFSQRQLPFYNTAAGTLTQTGAGVNYVDVRINYSDQTGMTTGSTINSSCVLLYFNTDDNTGYELPVLSITTPSSTNPVVRVDITGFPALNGAINGQGVIYKKSSSTHFAPFVSNASNSLQQVIQEAMTRDLNDALITGVDVTKYVGSGAPAFTPTTNEPKLAQGLASPYPLYTYNGSAWVLVGSGGGTTADTTRTAYMYSTMKWTDSTTVHTDNKVFRDSLAGGRKLLLNSYPTMDASGTITDGDLFSKYDSETGIYQKIRADSLLSIRNNVSGQPTFTTIPPTKTVAGASNDSITFINPSTGLITIANKTTISDKQTVINTTAAFVAQTDNTKDAVYFTEGVKQGWFYKVSTGTADSAVIFTDATGQKWKRQEANYLIRPEWFGAVASDGNDDATAIQRAIDYATSNNIATVQLSEGEYTLTKPVIIRKFSGGEYCFVTLTLRGTQKVYSGNVGGIGGTKIQFNNTTDFAVGIQAGRQCVIENIHFQSNRTAPSTLRGMIEWTQAEWIQSYRNNTYSPQAAICIDPFVKTRITGDRYPSVLADYDYSTLGRGTSGVEIKGCGIYGFLVAIMNNPSGLGGSGYTQVQNGDNIKISDCTSENVKIFLAQGQSQSRSNTITNLYTTGSIEHIQDCISYGTGSGTPAVMEHLNIAGGTKFLVRALTSFDDIKVNNSYFESLWCIGIVNQADFTDCTFSLMVGRNGGGYNIPSPPFILRNNSRVNFKGGSIHYFDNGVFQQPLFFDGAFVNFDGTAVGVQPLKPYSNSGGDETNNFNFSNATLSYMGAGYVTNGSAAGQLMGTINRYPMIGGQILMRTATNGQQRYWSKDQTWINYEIGSTTVNIDYTNSLATFITSDTGAFQVKQVLGTAASYNSTQFNNAIPFYPSSIPRGYFGYVSEIIRVGITDSIVVRGVPYGWVSGSQSLYLTCTRTARFIEPTYGNVSSTTPQITVASELSANFSIGDYVRGYGIADGTYVKNKVGNVITLSKKPALSGTKQWLYDARYSSETYSVGTAAITSSNFSVEPNGIIKVYPPNGLNGDSLVQQFVSRTGGIYGNTTYPLTWEKMGHIINVFSQNNNTGFNTQTPLYRVDIDAKTNSAGNPIRLQGLNVGATTDSIVTSASGVLRHMTINGMLGTTTSSLRVPRLTTTQRNALNGAAGSVTGDVIYNSTTDTYQVADGTTSNWIDLATGTTTYFSGSYDNAIAAGARDSVVITVSGLTTSTGAANVYYVATVHESGIVISPAKIETGQIKIYLDNLNLVTANVFSGTLKVMVRRL